MIFCIDVYYLQIKESTLQHQILVCRDFWSLTLDQREKLMSFLKGATAKLGPETSDSDSVANAIETRVPLAHSGTT